MSKTVLFWTVQLSSSVCILVLFDPEIGLYQVLPLRARVDLRVMAMKGVSHIPQSSSITGTSPSNCLVSYPGHLLWGGVLSFCKDTVGWISITVLHFKIDHVSHRTHGGWVDEYIQPSYVLPNGVHHRGYLIFIIFLKWITFFGILLFYLFMSKFADRSWEWLEGSVFNCYYTEVQVRVLLFSLNCFTLFESLAWLYLGLNPSLGPLAI